MTRTFSFRNLMGVSLCVLLAAACGDDEKKKSTSDPSETADGDADGKDDTDDAGQDPDEPADGDSDGEDPDPVETDGDEDPVDGGTAPESDGGEPQATPGTLLDLPHDGAQGSICYEGEDCQGDDLLCYAPSGDAPGFCTQDCKEDADCSPIGGIAATCSADGLCRIDCSGDSDQGDGACPVNMECRDLPNPIGITPGQIIITDILSTAWRCVYPVDGGKNNVAQNQKCDLSHGDGDCEGVLLCHSPGVSAEPGYCTNACESEAECTAPAGTTALVPVCAEGGCEFDCAGDGAVCPAGMNCKDVDGSLISETWRCRFNPPAPPAP